MRKDSQGDRNLQDIFALNFLFNRDVDDLDWAFGERLLFVESEDTASLPWPERIVQNLKIFDKSSAWAALEDAFGLLLDNGSLGVPRMLNVFTIGASLGVLSVHVLVPGLTERGVAVVWEFRFEILHVLTEFLHHIAHLGKLLLFLLFSAMFHGLAEILFHRLASAFAAHLVHELFHHAHETASGTSTAATSSAATATPSSPVAATTTAPALIVFISVSSVLLALALRVNGRLRLDVLIWGSDVDIVWEHGDHNVWSTSSLSDLEEWVLVTEAFFTIRTVVEVFADAALVTDSPDRDCVAAVTSDVGVFDIVLLIFVKFFVFRLLDGTTKVLALQQVVEDFK